jgi:hypothetical protein
MEVQHGISLAALTLSIGSALILVSRAYGKIASMSEEFGRRLGLVEVVIARVPAVEVKVDTLWLFQLRRGEAEIVARGLGTQHSPLLVGAEARRWLDPIAADLRAWYRAGHQGLALSDLPLCTAQARRGGVPAHCGSRRAGGGTGCQRDGGEGRARRVRAQARAAGPPGRGVGRYNAEMRMFGAAQERPSRRNFL